MTLAASAGAVAVAAAGYFAGCLVQLLQWLAATGVSLLCAIAVAVADFLQSVQWQGSERPLAVVSTIFVEVASALQTAR